MSETTPIEWTDATWSPWEGCTKVGPGCDHCYAEGMNRWLRKGANWGPGAPRRTYSEEHWQKPVTWNLKAMRDGTTRRVFPSVCDPFDNEANEAERIRFWDLIDRTPNLTWLLLTKRIGNVERFIPLHWMNDWPAHVWLGATVVNQEEADRDIPKLLDIRGVRVRFLSCEPLLGPIHLRRFFWKCCGNPEPGGYGGSYFEPPDPPTCCNEPDPREELHWVIVGGESGPHARPMVLGWAKDVVAQCRAAGVPVLVKQLGAKPTNREGVPHSVSDKKGGNIAEFPVELQVREFPCS